MTFNKAGDLFIGDNRGDIHQISTKVTQDIDKTGYYYYSHPELEGDQINKIIVNGESMKELYVHSRDNCIRLINLDSSKGGVKVKDRYFGSKCSNFMIKSCVSPDNRFIVSGSETGMPYIWDVDT